MSRMTRTLPLAVLIAMAVYVPAASAESKFPAHVRVVTESARVTRWLAFPADIILTVDQGTMLAVLDREENWKNEDWYWVVLPPDAHGSRKVGWIRASVVEPVLLSQARTIPTLIQRDDSYSPALMRETQPTSDVLETLAAGVDRVTIGVRPDAPAASPTEAADATKPYTFEDVHFERDRSSIRGEDLDKLRGAATALKGNTSLAVVLEGHTCSLGTTAYNLDLGVRRAMAVKDFLVSQGVPADRLLTVSRGEADAKYDNASEETRRLNRRVALVPQVQR